MPSPSKRKTKRGPDAIDINAGAILHSLRCWRGLSQQKLAEELGMTFQQVQKYEHGKNRMALSTLYRISCILNVSVIDFFAGLDNVLPYTENLYLSKDEINLLKAFRTISSDDLRKQVMKMVGSIAECRLDDD